MSLIAFAQQVLNGASIGVIYALTALGLTLIFGILRIINFAHGELYMLGAFGGYMAFTILNSGFFAAVAFAAVFGAVIGLLIERLAIRPLQGSHEFAVLLSTLGLSIFLQNTALVIWGPNPREITLDWASKVVTFGPLLTTQMRLVALVTGLCLIGFLAWFIHRTSAGTAMRAVARDPDAAALMGIDVNRIYGLTFGLGAALAAVSGAFLGAIFTIEPTMGEWVVVKAFAIVIMGGLGNVPGAVIGGVILGVAESLGAAYLPGGGSYKDGIGYVIMILVLLLRPQGIFGKRL